MNDTFALAKVRMLCIDRGPWENVFGSFVQTNVVRKPMIKFHLPFTATIH